MKGFESVIDDFCNGSYDCDLPDEVWKPVFEGIANSNKSLKFEKDKIHTLWTVNGGHLRRKVKDDDLVGNVLSVSLPGYNGEGLILYRGELRFLYESGKVGFCWTPRIDVAKKFASAPNAAGPGGGMLLKAFAPSEAVLAPPNAHSSGQMKEFEYTCNPKLLINIEIQETFKQVY